MSWTRDQVRVLINEYKKHPCLYMVKTKQYLNKHMRLNALNLIKEALHLEKVDVSISEIKTKFAGLKSTFYVEYKKHKQSLSSGAGEDEIYQPSLWYFKDLLFLLDHNESRKSTDSINVEHETPSSNEEGSAEELTCDNLNTQDTSNSSIGNTYIVNNNIGILEEVLSQEEHTQGTPKTDGSSSSSIYENKNAAPKIKKNKKIEVSSEDYIIKAATATLNKLACSIESQDQIPIRERVHGYENADKAFSNFVVSKLSQIKNQEVRLLTEQKIITILFEGITNDIQINKN